MLSDTDNSLRSFFLSTSKVTFEPGTNKEAIDVSVRDLGHHEKQTQVYNVPTLWQVTSERKLMRSSGRVSDS